MPEAGDAVLFYEGKHYYLSNFSSFMVEWMGALWPTSEHAYQAAKFRDMFLRKSIRRATSAHEAKKLARRHSNEIRPDWDEVKVDCMRSILTAKLQQHTFIQDMLVGTGDAELVEDSPRDSFWGRGPDWDGENQLGNIWMGLRAEFVSQVVEHE